jgi:hypothetical protein
VEFQLVRLILIDSYSPGRVVEFPLDGGAVLTGRNGRGKTTLLQLLPIFYGENPTRIVGTETNRLDFNAFYLPRLTSYICFEYRRRDQVCLVVLHQSQQGGERRYRFVRSPYRPDMFLLDERNILQAPDLRRHFKLSGVDHSEAISAVSEYRAIIQGRSGSGKGAQRQRALVADYAFVGPGHHLTHIERIVSGMFLRRTDFQDLQRMVVSCIADNDAEIALATERRKIASWPEDYAAYTRVMDEADRYAQVQERESRLRAVEAELGRIHARAQRLLTHLEHERDENRVHHRQESAAALQEEREHKSTADVVRQRQETAGREAKDQERRAAALDRQQQEWLNQDLPSKAERLEREPQLRERLGGLNARREALLGEQEKISLKYERLLNEQDRRRALAESAAGQARTELHQGFEPRLKALEAEARTDVNALRAEHAKAREVQEQQLGGTLERKGEWVQRAKAPQPDPKLEEILDAKREEVRRLESEHQGAEEEVREARQRLQEAKDVYQSLEEQLARLARKRSDLVQRRDLRIAQQSPGGESLLHFLRSNRPDWAFDIAKVVREDLLVRTDLQPELVDTLPALYGVGLELVQVDAHLAADEAALSREIAEIEDQIRLLDTERKDVGERLAVGERKRREADKALDLATHRRQKVETQLNSARDEARSAERRVEQSRKEAGQRARQELDATKRVESELKQALKTLDQDHAAAVQARETQLGLEREALEGERSAALREHDQAQEDRRRERAAERAATEAERDQALGAAGVDTATLKPLEAEIRDLDRRLAAIEQSRNQVSQWRHWLKNEWPHREEYLRAAQVARVQEAEARTELAAEDRRWKVRTAELQAALQGLDKAHARLEREVAAVRGRLERFRDYPPDEGILGGAFDPGWSLNALVDQANANITQVSDLTRSITAQVEHIKRSFSAERGSPPDQFYESHRIELGPDAGVRAWIGVFKGWFDHEHDAYRRTLAVEASQIAGAIVAFHRDMDAFHRKVQQFNRELQQSLDENLGFESVSRVTIEVKSVIRELEYWQPIETMADEHRAWLSLDGRELPPPEFALTLRTLLDHWEVREGIRAALPNLIRIQGEVVENGQMKTFRKAADLERVSSHGLSYLILCVIFIAFINRIRRQARVEVVWALDELKDLDIGNIEALLAILKRNAITLISAFPDPDAEVLTLFKHRFSVEEGRRLMEVRLYGPGQDEAVPVEPEIEPPGEVVDADV